MIGYVSKCFKCCGVLVLQSGPLFHRPLLRTSRNLANFRPNLTFGSARKLHCTPQNRDKIFIDIENAHAYSLLPEMVKFSPPRGPANGVTTVEDFDQVLDQNWRSSTAGNIVEAFEKVKDVATVHNINLSDRRFDKIVDGLMDQCEKLSDEELLRLLLVLVEYPPCEASNSHNFHDVWSCLDDMCRWRIPNWDVKKLYTFAEVWYRWNLGRLSDFVYEALDKVTQKPQRLTKNMLLYTFFYLNVNRRKVIPFEVEHVLSERIDEFGVDELAVIAMGYFKTKAKVKPPRVVRAMIRAIRENRGSINEITLAALLKAIRLSQRVETAEEIPPMLDDLTEQIPRLSIMSLIHIALIGTSLQIKHESSLRRCAERMLKEIEDMRIKDIERLLLACAMFDVETTPSLYGAAFNEIHKEERRKEFIQYNRCLPSTLLYLSLRKLYSYPLMNQILDVDYIDETYGKSSKFIPREIFSLDCSIDVECPDYGGTRLPPLKRYKAAKWLTEFTPTPIQPKRHSLADKAYLEVAECVKNAVGDERLLRHDHVLPHFSKSDIILCKERSSGEFVAPFGFENYILGDVKRPFELEKYEWLALVVLTPSLKVRGSSVPLGSAIMKERQLKAVGYTPIMVCTSTLANLPPSDRVPTLRRQLSQPSPVRESRREKTQCAI